MAINWELIKSIAETGLNIAEIAVAPGLVGITQAAENAANPLLEKLISGTPVNVDTEVMAFYGTAIAGWNYYLANAKPAPPPDVVAKVSEYIKDTTDAMNAYFAAGLAAPADLNTPVTPIVVPAGA